METGRFALKYNPRWYQIMIHNAFNKKGYKRVYALFHRRAGKDICAFNHIVNEANRGIAGLYYYICPTYQQGKKIIWTGINEDGQRIIDYIPKKFVKRINNSEMLIEFKNGSILQVVGCDNYDSLRGTNPRGVVFSEYAMMDERVWTEVISPILRKNGGWALFQTTPLGRNHAYDLWRQAEENEKWYTLKITIDDTDLISKEQIDEERAEGKEEPTIQQEYYCFPEGDVICADGVKDISEICEDDMVLSHSGRFRKVTGTISRDYEGDIYTIKTYGHYKPLICTGNHPIRIYCQCHQKYCWVPASEVKKGDQVCFPKMVSFPETLPLSMLELIAWYTCEGSSAKNLVQFTLGNANEVAEVCELLDNLYYQYKVYDTGTAVNIVVNDCGLVDFLRINCGTASYNKKIPLHLIGNYYEEFLQTLISGDGCITKTDEYERWTFTTTSKTLAYQVQLLATTVGYTSGISKRMGGTSTIEGRDVNCRDSYQVQIGVVKNRNRNGPLRISKYNQVATVRSVSREHKSVKVYNFSVQHDESYTINGRSVHNCSFSKGLLGAYYQELIDKMYTQDRITDVPWNPTEPVYCAFDLGMTDSTAIVWYQYCGRQIHFIDAEEYNNKSIQFYAKLLMDKPYVYGGYYFPHDLAVQELGTGMSRAEVFRNYGIEPYILERKSIQSGIENARALLMSRAWFDAEKCKTLIKCLEHYHREYDEKNKVMRDKPKHDFSSHFADAFRYASMAIADGLSGEVTATRDRYRLLRAQHKILA